MSYFIDFSNPNGLVLQGNQSRGNRPPYRISLNNTNTVITNPGSFPGLGQSDQYQSMPYGPNYPFAMGVPIASPTQNPYFQGYPPYRGSYNPALGTQALAEEGGPSTGPHYGGQVSTMALGEEGGSVPYSPPQRPPQPIYSPIQQNPSQMTTYAMGEEGGFVPYQPAQPSPFTTTSGRMEEEGGGVTLGLNIDVMSSNGTINSKAAPALFF